MSDLAPNLFDRRFADFLEIGRARLRSLAPQWTDHNAHDPGITLMELIAWASEAQLYSLSHLRRDERIAYAAMFDLASAGTRGATGLIWSDPLDPSAPAATHVRSTVLSEDAVIQMKGEPAPLFNPEHRILWIPGRIARLETRSSGGRIVDHTLLNERGLGAFLPFGEIGGRSDVLALTFTCNDRAGPFGDNRGGAVGALWAIGIRAAPPAGGADEGSGDDRWSRKSPLVAMLVTDDERISVPIVSDSTHGMLTTGALMLDLADVPNVQTFTIELRSRTGFARPPRMLRIEPSVVPIRQGRRLSRELHVVTGLPDTKFALDMPGLRFEPGEEAVVVEVADASGLTLWTRCDRLSERGPGETAYELDARNSEITLGNGINGKIAPEGAQVLVSYAVSDAEGGNVARNRKWQVAGFQGVFGINSDPVKGGASPSSWVDQRREARRLSREAHALVSSADIESAARALPLLEVMRAWVVLPNGTAPRTGAVRLVAMRSREDGKEPERIPESSRWLEAIRRRLSPRMPLGTRLEVMAPRYVDVFITAQLECDPGRDPASVRDAVDITLRGRLALVQGEGEWPPRQPGVPVTYRDLSAWIRATDGVRRITALQLLNARKQSVDKIAVPRGGLPRWRSNPDAIRVSRPGAGGAR